MATIKDIARLSGYSTGTVSRVLNNRSDVSEEAKEKIEKVIKETSYQPNSNARMLKQTVSPDTTVIVRASKSIFLESILEEIQKRMREHGEMINTLFIGETDDEIAAAVQIMQSRKPKGLIFIGGSLDNFSEGFSRITVPSVLVTADAKELGFENLSSFTTDDEDCAACAIKELYSRGHRRIGILGGYPAEQGEIRDSYRESRLRGAVRELERNGIPFDPAGDYEACEYSARGGFDAAKRLLERSRDLTGIFALNDAIAAGAMRAFADMGLNVPEDISVIGFNGSDYVHYTIPRISSIRQDITMLASRSVDDLLLRISYGGPAVHEKIPYEFINGESLAPPRR